MTNKNYTITNIGKLNELKEKTFLKDKINSTGAEISFEKMPAKTAQPFFHSHKQNEEIYVFLKGNGQVQLDNEVLEISEGSVLRVAPKASRSINNSSDQEMIYMVIQVKENSLEQYTIADGIIDTTEAKWK